MNDKNELNNAIKERQKRGLKKGLGKTLLLLLPPAFALGTVVLLSNYSFITSLLLIYFILPMFYTVDKRIRFALTGIGNSDYNYKDGYNACFKQRKNGLFGVIMSMMLSISIGLLIYFIMSNFTAPFFNMFEESKEPYAKLIQILKTNALNYDEMVEFMVNNAASFTRPMAVILSVVLFVPILVLFFYSIPENLFNHYLASIVMPDLDKNVTVSQARNLARSSFARPIKGRRIKMTMARNWPYYLIFTGLYTLSTYLVTLITTTNNYLMPIIILITPTFAVIYGSILMFVCVYNGYAVTEELSNTLLDLLPPTMKTSIYQTYNNPLYVHAEESAVRGSFVPNPNTYNTYYAQPETVSPDVETPNEETPKEESKPASFVVDFSNKSDDKENKD